MVFRSTNLNRRNLLSRNSMGSRGAVPAFCRDGSHNQRLRMLLNESMMVPPARINTGHIPRHGRAQRDGAKASGPWSHTQTTGENPRPFVDVAQ